MIAWDDFRLVKAIADTRSLTGAAQSLGLNHSTVFRRLGDLEKRLSLTLFERHRSGYALTPAGTEMVALAQRMDDEVVRFERRLAGQEVAASGDVRVTTNDTLLVHLLMPVLAGFGRLHPSIRLDIVLSNQSLNLSRRDADVALRATDNPPETLIGRRLAGIAWAVYGRRADCPEALPETGVDPSILSGRRWVSIGDGLGHLQVAHYVRAAAPTDHIALRVNTVLGLTEAVEQGIGIGPLPCFIADTRPGLMRLAPINPDFSTGLWLLTHPDLKSSPRVRAFLDYAGHEIARQRPLLEGEWPIHS